MAEVASCTIYIKGTPVGTTEAEVREATSKYGDITEVVIPEGKDFCFVEFAEEAQAQGAAESGGFDVSGARVSVEMRRPRRSRRERATVPEGTSTSVYIPGLPDEADRDALREMFEGFGLVKRVDVRQRQDGSRYAFVEFDSHQVVEDILAHGDFKLAGQELLLEERKSVSRAPKAPRERREPRGSYQGAGGGGYKGDEQDDGEGGGGGRSRRVPPVPEHSVYIKGFSQDTQEQDIRDEFEKYGEIVSIILRVKHIGEEVRTWAFVEYAGAEFVAVALQGAAGGLTLNGEQCTVEARKSTPTPRHEHVRAGRRGGYGSRNRGHRNRDNPAHQEQNHDVQQNAVY